MAKKKQPEEIGKATIDSIQQKVREIATTQRKTNVVVMPIVWDIGSLVLRETKATKDTIHSISSRIPGCSTQLLYTATKIAQIHTRAQITKLAERGMTVGHFEYLAKVSDQDARKQLETQVADEHLTVEETRKRVKETLGDSEGDSDKEPKEKKASSKGDKLVKRGPVPTLARFARSVADAQAYATDLTLLQADFGALGVDEAVVALGTLEELKTSLPGLKEVCEQMKPVVETIEAAVKKAKKGGL